MLAERRKLKFFVICLIAAVLVVHVDAQNSCTTVRKKEGECVPQLKCGTITTLLRMWPDPPPPQVIRYINMVECGTFDDITYVCCEKRSVLVGGASAPAPSPRTSTTPTTTTIQPPVAAAAAESVTRKGVPKTDADTQAGMSILQAVMCGTTTIDRVANGEDARLSEFPWMALLVYDDGLRRTMDCGGSLITERYVLTAAHCLRHRARLASVRLGEHDTKSEKDCEGRGRKRRCAPPIQEIDVEEAIYHESYSKIRYSDDIGLIRLVTKAIFRTNVRPICLPITPSSQTVNLKKMQIAGWGQIENGLRASLLQKALVLMHDNDYCQDIFRLINVSNRQLCAGGEDQIASCRGDSGGPLFYSVLFRRSVRYVQYGIVSAGSELCGTDYPDVFANVTAYLPWIASNIRL